MTTTLIADVLLICTLINYSVLLLWFGAFTFAHTWLYHLHGRWFRISPEHFDAIHYAAMAIYKIGIFLLNLAPYIALRIVA
jgi:hypothetical protein